MKARIFKPSKSAMQSGRGKTHSWILEFEPTAARHQDPLMGWSSSSDTRAQLRLKFPSQDEAIAYAERKGIAYQVEEAQERTIAPKSYSDNFAYKRKTPWSH